MNTAHRRRTGFGPEPATILMLSLLWVLPLITAAGELTDVPAKRPPGLSLPDLAGRQRNLDEFAGKVVLVTFWASWCSPCIEEMPSIRQLAGVMSDQTFAVVAVNVGEGLRRARVAARRIGIDFPVLLDTDSSAFRAWGADVLPTAFILDHSGRIRYLAQGPVDWEQPHIVGMLKRLAADREPTEG